MIKICKIPKQELKSHDYNILIDGQVCEAYPARVIGIRQNSVWEGTQTPLEYTEWASFINFEFSGKAEFSIDPQRKFYECKIRPSSKNIVPQIKNGKAYFTITQAGQYTVEFDGEHNALHIFANAITQAPKKDEVTYYFDAGVHNPGRIDLKNGESVYIDSDAVVYGSIFGNNISNVSISGLGILDNSFEERVTPRCYEDDTIGCIKFYNSSNINIEGITCRDSAIWVINAFNCHDVVIDNIKQIGMWRKNTDGIDICSSHNVIIKNSFLRNFDDSIVIKGIPGYGYRNVYNVKTENCVVWCDWGRALEVGAETVADEMHDITFDNCDVIHNAGVVLDVQNCDRACVYNVLFNNIRVEYSRHRKTEMGLIEANVLNGYYGIHFDDPNVIGSNKNIRFTNIFATVEEIIGEKDLPHIIITGFNEKHMTEDILVENLLINGEKAIHGKNCVLKTNQFTKNIIIK